LTIEAFGRLDVIVNNAGTGLLKPLSETSDEDLQRVFGINLEAAIRMIRDALPHLVKSCGCVVNVSSTLAGASVAHTGIYAASKAGLERVTRTLAVELGPRGVRVNAVAPGVTRTEMAADDAAFPLDEIVAQTPLRRLGEPLDIARAIAFLASDEAAWITGQTLQSSGGFMLG
jgi:meso-butanediol dehydrogenase / (S,S)-butanediol dehydrogenase / diacetyl reductase